MNPGQEHFLSFIIDRVQDGKQEDAKALLNESFAKQAEGSFDAAYLQDFAPRMMALLRPECVGEVQTVMDSFGSMNQAAQQEMSRMQFCQSCGMPFDEAHRELVAKEADGSESPYCTYCYKDGAFVDPDATMQDMIEICVPHLAEKIGEPAARAQMEGFLPTLARWKNI